MAAARRQLTSLHAPAPRRPLPGPHLLQALGIPALCKVWVLLELGGHSLGAEPRHFWPSMPVKDAKYVHLVAHVLRDVRILLQGRGAR